MEQLKLRTAAQSKKLWALLSKMGIAHYRKAMAIEYSNERTDSTAKLTTVECARLIDDLEKQLPQKMREMKIPGARRNRMLRKFFHYCHELGWKTEEGKLDYKRIANWCLKYSYMHKHYSQYNDAELPGLVSQLHQVLYDKDIKDDKDE